MLRAPFPLVASRSVSGIGFASASEDPNLLVSHSACAESHRAKYMRLLPLASLGTPGCLSRVPVISNSQPAPVDGMRVPSALAGQHVGAAESSARARIERIPKLGGKIWGGRNVEEVGARVVSSDDRCRIKLAVIMRLED